MSQFRVLVVESDPHFAEVIKYALEAITDGRQASYRASTGASRLLEVEIVADGNQALQISKTSPPHLILLCVELPKMSGYSICNKLKKNPELKAIPLIIMSSEATPDIFEQHMKLKTRAEDYLIKPFPMEDLQEKVTTLLGISAVNEFSETTDPDNVHGSVPVEIVNDDTTSSGAVRFDVAKLQMGNEDIEIEDDEVEVADEYLISTGDPPIIDNEINQATDLAFAALELPDESAPSPRGRADDLVIDSSSLVVTEDDEDVPPFSHSEEPLPPSALEVESEEVLGDDVSMAQDTTSGVFTTPPPGSVEPDAPTRFEPMMIQMAKAPIKEASWPKARAIEPEIVAPKIVEPEIVEPGIMEPEIMEPEIVEPEIVEPEITVDVKPEPAVIGVQAPRETEAYPVDLPKHTREHDEVRGSQRRSTTAESSASLILPTSTDDELRQTVKELEREKRRLNDELQNARAKTGEASSNFSHDRDMLGLREVINKKEKEILDLKDDLDAKERQILDHKDKVRELERKVRDMDEKLLSIEREMMTVNERCQALNVDKEKIVIREKGIKERLDQAKQEIDKSYQENDLLKKKHTAAITQLEAEKAAAIEEKEEELRARVDQHLGELQRLRDTSTQEREKQQAAQEEALSRQAEDYALAVDQLKEQHQSAMAQASEAHARALAEADQMHRDEISAINVRHQGEKDTISATHERELNQLQAENEQALAHEHATLTSKHEAAVATLKEEHQTTLELLRKEHAGAQSHLIERHHQELERREADYAGAKEALRTEHKNELDKLVQEHQSALVGLKKTYEGRLQELEQSQKDRVAGMETRHQNEREAFESARQREKQALESQIAERDQTLKTIEEQLRNSELQLDESLRKGSELEQALETANNTIGEIKGQVVDLEQESENYRNQISRAVNKIRSDEQLADKAKRAMAIAVTLLEEQKRVTHEFEAKP